MSLPLRCLGCAAILTVSAAPALADGYPPFYGFSPYFGAPATYFTPEPDVHQVTRRTAPDEFDMRTSYQGGPFWRYKSHREGFGRAPSRRNVVLRRKG